MFAMNSLHSKCNGVFFDWYIFLNDCDRLSNLNSLSSFQTNKFFFVRNATDFSLYGDILSILTSHFL